MCTALSTHRCVDRAGQVDCSFECQFTLPTRSRGQAVSLSRPQAPELQVSGASPHGSTLWSTERSSFATERRRRPEGDRAAVRPSIHPTPKRGPARSAGPRVRIPRPTDGNDQLRTWCPGKRGTLLPTNLPMERDDRRRPSSPTPAPTPTDGPIHVRRSAVVAEWP